MCLLIPTFTPRLRYHLVYQIFNNNSGYDSPTLGFCEIAQLFFGFTIFIEVVQVVLINHCIECFCRKKKV